MVAAVTRLALTPWARQRLSAEDHASLDARADQLDVDVAAIYGSRSREWTVRVFRGDVMTNDLRAHGGLAIAIAGALDDFEQLPAVVR